MIENPYRHIDDKPKKKGHKKNRITIDGRGKTSKGYSRIDALSDKAKEDILKMKGKGMTNAAISSEIGYKYNETISKDIVGAYFRKRGQKAIQVYKEDEKLQSKLAQQYFDTIGQVRNLNEEGWMLLYAIKRDPELNQKSVDCPHCKKKFPVKVKSYQAQLKAMEHLLNQIKHVDSILGRLQNKQLNVTYNVVDLTAKLTKVMPIILKKMENQDVIKIKKKRFVKEMSD